MPSIARVGDTVVGTCSGGGHLPNRAFTGVWTTGSGSITANGLGTIRTGDTGNTNCGHQFTPAVGSGSTSVTTEGGKRIHRVGDPVRVLQGGSGTTISGSGTVTSG